MIISTTIERATLLSLAIAWIALTAYAADGPALANAAERRDATAVATLLEQKADPNIAQVDGMTALLWASYHDDVVTAQRLINSGADVGATNRYGISALSLACTNGNGALVRLLLKNGADPNTTQSGGETVLMTASRTGRLDAVKALLTSGAKVDAKERRGQTALMWAAAEGHADVVDALIDAGADYSTPLSSGFTPLCFAVRNGHIAVTRRLLAAKVDVNAAMTEARGGRNLPERNTSPLLLAMENGHFELASILLEAGADPNDMRTGFAPLHAMSWIRKPEKGDNESGAPPPTGSGKLTSLQFVRVLVAHGAEVNLRKESDGGGRLRISVKDTTPFLCAAATADVEYMKTLLKLGANPKLENSRGQTALMMAAGIGEKPEGDGPGTKAEHLAAVMFLLELGAAGGQDINALDNNGETAMHAAAYKSLPDVIALLDQRGADINIWAKPSEHGRTPLSIAQGYRPGNFKPSFETVAAIKNVMNAHGVTPSAPLGKRDEGYRD
jgi:ankyrin repeat protein